MAEPTTELESVRILRLQPGDTIVVRLAEPRYLTAAMAQDIKDHIHGLHPGHQVLVLGPNVDLEIVRDGDDA